MSTQAARPDPGCVRAWADAYGMPDSYAGVDVEASGLDVDRDYVLQLGWCTVVDRSATENAGVVVDPTRGSGEAMVAILGQRLAETAYQMQKREMQYPWTIDRLRRDGLPPRQAAARFVTACDKGDHVVAHYGTSFDFPLIDRFCSDAIGQPLPTLDSNRLIDTAVMYKAAVLSMRPRPTESLGSFSARVLAVRRSPKISMAACVAAFNLEGAGAVTRRAHDAIYDSWLAHLVFECLRRVAEGKVT